MITTFAHAAREIASKHVTAATIKGALDTLGAKAEHGIDELDTERKLALANHFVRALRNVGVVDAHRIEHELLAALGAAPTSRRAVMIKDAISLITVRNHVGQLVTALGVPWSVGMQVQSAVSDIARYVSANGGGKIETEALGDGRILCEVWTNRLVATPAPGAPTPQWLVAVSKLADGLRARPAGAGTHLTFSIAMPREALVA